MVGAWPESMTVTEGVGVYIPQMADVEAQAAARIINVMLLRCYYSPAAALTTPVVATTLWRSCLLDRPHAGKLGQESCTRTCRYLKRRARVLNRSQNGKGEYGSYTTFTKATKTSLCLTFLVGEELVFLDR